MKEVSSLFTTLGPKRYWIDFIDHNVYRAPEQPAAYMLANASGSIIYIGHGQNLRESLIKHKTAADGNVSLQKTAKHYTFIVTDKPAEAWQRVMDWYRQRYGGMPDFNRPSPSESEPDSPSSEQRPNQE